MATRTDEYRAKAAACAKQAQQTDNSTMKDVYQDVACMWLRLAEQADVRSAIQHWPVGKTNRTMTPRGSPKRSDI
jgi:hypothetical protein